ncbi:MAG: SIS domain-containing protein [Acutalibacteraceae bacterium]|nr:SIS domain-containing protein [Acutalibacteraceae bacterium]
MITDKYFDRIVDVLNKIKSTQTQKVMAAAEAVSNTILNDGIIYIFGCGHSHLIALDCFYRSGGLANVSAMLDTDLMLHNGAAKSSKMEKMSGIAESVFKRYCVTDKDLIIIVSTSGKNTVPIEMAQIAANNKIKSICVTSSEYFADKKDAPLLYECTDIYIDNCVPHGDAVIDISGAETKMGSVSTAASSFILQTVLMEGADAAGKSGKALPVYMSGNVDGGAEFNSKLIDKYMPRIKHL